MAEKIATMKMPASMPVVIQLDNTALDTFLKGLMQALQEMGTGLLSARKCMFHARLGPPHAHLLTGADNLQRWRKQGQKRLRARRQLLTSASRSMFVSAFLPSHTLHAPVFVAFAVQQASVRMLFTLSRAEI